MAWGKHAGPILFVMSKRGLDESAADGPVAEEEQNGASDVGHVPLLRAKALEAAQARLAEVAAADLDALEAQLSGQGGQLVERLAAFEHESGPREAFLAHLNRLLVEVPPAGPCADAQDVAQRLLALRSLEPGRLATLADELSGFLALDIAPSAPGEHVVETLLLSWVDAFLSLASATGP